MILLIGFGLGGLLFVAGLALIVRENTKRWRREMHQPKPPQAVEPECYGGMGFSLTSMREYRGIINAGDECQCSECRRPIIQRREHSPATVSPDEIERLVTEKVA